MLFIYSSLKEQQNLRNNTNAEYLNQEFSLYEMMRFQKF